MLNMIRMELFRMFKTKSLYVIWTIFCCSYDCDNSAYSG